jgi:FK506-binding protein 4/5
LNDDFDFAGPRDNPILKVGEEKEIGKQGLKKLPKEGEGWDTPDVGDEVHGTYVLSSLI